MDFRKTLAKFAAAIVITAVSASASAAIITVPLGNTSSGLVDGDTPTTVALAGIQGGQPSPFDSGIGSDALSFLPNAAAFSFLYAAITDTILSATLTIEIADHDSAGAGSQLDNFSLDGTDFTSELDTLFEASGGDDMEFNSYTLTLASSFFASLADGTLNVDLDLGGTGLAFSIVGGSIVATAGNGFHLISSTLVIETDDGSGGGPMKPVPGPTTLVIMAIGLLGVSRAKGLLRA